MIETLICDMDDTLLPCGIHYKERRQRFIDYSVARTGFPPELIGQVFDGIDLGCTILPNGFSKERYPKTFEAASAALDVLRGGSVSSLAQQKAYTIGASVFDAPYYLFEGVWDTLHRFKNAGVKLVLLTKGDPEIQQRKIDKNHLTEIFPLSHIHIVPKKGVDQLRQITLLHGMDVEKTAYVGDSLRDDIEPAGNLGIHSIYLNHPDTPAWSYDFLDVYPDVTIQHFHELLTIYPV
jgi:putative hydrolase of the HAD superfamily